MPKKMIKRRGERRTIRITGWACMFLLVIATTELTATIGLWFMEGTFTSYRELWQEIRHAEAVEHRAAEADAGLNDPEILNPYFGASYAADLRINNRPYSQEKLADYGFKEDAGPLVRERSPDRFIINITGGSVARGFLDWGGRDALVKELSKLPELQGKEIVFSSSAFYAHKEPQQLLALNYLLSLGAKFDLVVAIDGFNEITMGKTYGEKAGSSPFYPARWYGNLWPLHADPAQTMKRAEIELLREKRRRWAELFDALPLGRTMTMGCIWKTVDLRMESGMRAEEAELSAMPPSANVRSFVDSGPMPHYKTTSDYLKDQTSVWEESTRQLARLSAANDMHFISILQPNQYAGDHVMSMEEKRIAWTDGNPFKPLVEEGYPLLREAGERLRGEGVVFEDFSNLFDATSESVYTDDCCHFNAPQGNVLLAKRLAGVIAEVMKKK